MASVRNLKKDINYVLGDIIQECYVWELAYPEKDSKKAQAIIDEAIKVFDTLVEKLKAKTDNKKKHYNSIRVELEKQAVALLDKVNKL